MDTINKVYPFNNNIETGLRTLCLLNAFFPKSYDLESLVCLDYICVHSGDFEPQVESLHPPNPSRSGEIFIRRSIIENGLNMLIQKGLVNKLYLTSGIEYSATEFSSAFLDSMTSVYSLELISRAEWVNGRYGGYTREEIESIVKTVATNYVFQTQR